MRDPTRFERFRGGELVSRTLCYQTEHQSMDLNVLTGFGQHLDAFVGPIVPRPVLCANYPQAVEYPTG